MYTDDKSHTEALQDPRFSTWNNVERKNENQEGTNAVP
jgi:hypothetical protein